MNPVIGIVICGLAENRQFVSAPYVQAIEDTGSVPLILPRIDNFQLFRYYSALCHGFLFCGGDDISPHLFGEDLKTDKGHTDARTDYFHLSLMRELLSASRPILGICRGMQVLNIALGGTIYQDISLRPDYSTNHMQVSASRSDPCHRVSFSAGSLLYELCGNYLDTNSYHHQALRKIGKNLRVTGMSSDGIAEAVESAAHPFCVGVQWHPECMYQEHAGMRELFLKLGTG